MALNYFDLDYRNNEELSNRFKIKHVARKVGSFTSTRYRLAPDDQVQMSGYLKFRLGQRGKWKESWWALKDHVLYKYKAMGNPEAEETVVVLGWKLETLSDVRFLKNFNRESIKIDMSELFDEIATTQLLLPVHSSSVSLTAFSIKVALLSNLKPSLSCSLCL